MEYRHIPFITLSEIKSRVWITLSDCNFNCKECFSPAKHINGKKMSVDELVDLVKKASFKHYQKLPDEVIITGGEPTLTRSYLLDLVSKLDFTHVIMETNGYLLDEEYIDQLVEAGLKEIMLDLKAYEEELHGWYTGFSNRPILQNMRNMHEKIKLIVKTVYIPGIVDGSEIEDIAIFISTVDPEIEYRLNDFKPSDDISRSPSKQEMEHVCFSAKKHLKNVIISRSCRREGLVQKKKSWITVFPDGTFKRRSLKNY